MKKLTALLLTLAMTLALAACGGGASSAASSEPASSEPAASEPASSPAESLPAEDGGEGEQLPEPDPALAQMVQDIYAIYPVEIKMLETLAVDPADTEWATWQTGMDADTLALVDAVVVSESGVGSFAYSMVLARLKDAADAETLGNYYYEHADVGKWVCVFPTALAVTGYGDVVCFVMADEEIADPFALADAFAEVAGGSDFRQEKTELSMADAGMVGFEIPGDGGSDASQPPAA